MPFTTWSDLKTKLLDAMNDGSWMHKSFEAAGKKVEFRTVAEIEQYYEFVCRKASAEVGVSYGRTYARGGGRF